MNIITLEETASTNTWLTANLSGLPNFSIVMTKTQSAGRGQRGNSWESEPGKNLTFSMLYHPVDSLRPADQFCISEAVALSIADFLAFHNVEAKVKWPNDIYVGDKKICGILIEHSLYGTSILHSILGIGLNINQQTFHSDAPNPVSLANITGEKYNLDETLNLLGEILMRRLKLTESPEGRLSLHTQYLENLWRGDGKPYSFRDTASNEIFQAIITDIEPQGFLHLQPLHSLPERTYAFKEVSFIL